MVGTSTTSVYYNRIGFIGINWLGITCVPRGYVGTIIVFWVGTINPPPLGLSFLVKVIILLKTFSNMSMFTTGSLHRKIDVRWSIALI